MERFLVVKLADLGDALTATPALRALRESFRAARIDALVTPVGAAVLTGLDSIDRLITFEKADFDRMRPSLRPIVAAARLGLRLRRERYSRVFLFHHLFTPLGRLKYHALLAATGAPWRAGVAESHPSFLTAIASDRGYGVKHEADYWLEVVALAGALPKASPRLELAVDVAARDRANVILGDRSATPRVALFPGAGSFSPGRRWPADNYVDVGRRLAARLNDGDTEGKLGFVVVGTTAERELAEHVCRGIGPLARNLAGQTDVTTLAAVLGQCDLFVGNDGGAMHVAVAVGIPVVAIFGPSNHVSWGPYGAAEWRDGTRAATQSFVFWQNLPCAPCLYRGFLPGTPSGCRAHDCLTLTQPSAVADAALHLLSKSLSARQT